MLLLFSNYLSVEISQTAHVSYLYGYSELFLKYVTDAQMQLYTEMTSAKYVQWYQGHAKLAHWLSA